MKRKVLKQIRVHVLLHAFVFSFSMPLFAQHPGDDVPCPDSSIVFVQEKNYWLPAVEAVGLNIGVWGYHKFLTKEGWATISWETVKRNFKTGFVWDNDGYLTNQFSHPYHGAAYFNAARSNGLGFWESAPYAFGGSLMWEYFMEDQPPSYNDIVNTPVTGILLGEISYRVSDLIIDESTGGVERLLRESAAFAVNPVRGFNRLIRGEMWRDGSSTKHREYLLRASTGLSNVFFSRKIANTRTYAFLGVDLVYGNPLDVSNHVDPFDYFVVHTEVSFRPDDNIVGIFASGVLWDTETSLFGNSKGAIGIYKELDILINAVYKLSATSVTGQLVDVSDISQSASLRSSFSLSAILMGATDSRYSIEYGKDYNIGPGASAALSSHLHLKNYGSVHLGYKRYWIHTLSGAESEQFVGLLKLGTTYEVGSSVNVGLDFMLYERLGIYKLFPDTETSNAALRLYAQFGM